MVKNSQGKLREDLHAEGRYKINHNGSWLEAGSDALEAQRRRSALLDQEELKRLRGIDSARTTAVLASAGRITLAAAAKNILPTAKHEVLILRASASIGRRSIRSSGTAT